MIVDRKKEEKKEHAKERKGENVCIIFHELC